MSISKFLLSNKEKCQALVDELGKKFKYVSILGTDVVVTRINANKNNSTINDTFDNELGFVVKMSNGGAFFEYSFDSFDLDIKELSNKILEKINISDELKNIEVSTLDVCEEKLIKDFSRPSDFESFNKSELLEFCKKTTSRILKKEPHFLNVNTVITTQEISKIFISKNKNLSQYYTWVNGDIIGTYLADNKRMSNPREMSFSNEIQFVLNELPTKIDSLIRKGKNLAYATQIKPGVYDIITDPSITGLIAHEAFGHGVEMDQFVKDRALAKKMVGQYVASPIVNMRDGASSVFSTASYFFDDDGVLAHDTQIIKDGKLVNGICDLVSSRQLGCEPTGNGRRQSYKRKAYTRMTNTFFEKGKDKLSDMIASIKHGYMLFETNNGMEDPKNWAIQCVCNYGIEIIDGKLTDNYVSPVVMSGFVPDLLKSITMISDEFEEEGSGQCGKGYKEWVRVSDGGAHLKAKVKLS